MLGRVSVVTGGLGYIGQSIVAELQHLNEEVVIIDRRSIESQVPRVRVITGDIRDGRVWRELSHTQVRAVFHCAGLIQVGESMTEPARYFDDNVSAGLAMLDHLRLLGDIPIVFSSSAAVYGVPDEVPIAEAAPLQPLSPYGVTKRQFEEILQAYGAAYGLQFVALRYFNAAGSHLGIRENHDPETHLLPRIAQAINAGQAPQIYGQDYPTADGTAIRDYIHISDLVEAHLRARAHLEGGGSNEILNVGSGRGASVLEMISAFKQRVPAMPEPHVQSRRIGDPPVLVANINRAKTILDWRPQQSDIERIIDEAWRGVK